MKRHIPDVPLHIEESLVDEIIGGAARVERPLDRGIFLFVTLVIGVVGLTIIGRILTLGVAYGEAYQERSFLNVHKTVIVPSQRGAIVDRYGKPFVKNIPTFNVSLDVRSVLQPTLRSTGSDTRYEHLSRILQRLAAALSVEPEQLAQEIERANWEQTNTVTLMRDIPLEQAIAIKTLNIEGVEVEDDYRRQYDNGPVFAHVVGYTGVGDTTNNVVGVAGLESYYDGVLRGQRGTYVLLRDAAGTNIDRKALTEARPGHQIMTTIDAEFQAYFHQRLQEGLVSLGRQAGVGLAIQPQTGEVLALVNLPSFDNNTPAAYLEAPLQPLFNRAIAGLYSPGSTIKPLVALAALKEKIVAPEWEAYSGGYLELPNPYTPEKPSRFLDWRAHGWVNLQAALARSSNIYFYLVGGGCPLRLNCESRPTPPRGLGIAKLHEYWQYFGLDKVTGIDLDGERSGFLPDPEEKERRTDQAWRIGDTYNVSIGQGDLTLTPLRLITFFASIANGGHLYRPYLVNQVLDESGAVVRTYRPEEALDYSGWIEEIQEVQAGLRDAIAQPYGTANKLYDLPYRTAGKTGSAQIANNTKTNAFFLGYGPYTDPQIAILVLVEDAKEGSVNTLPIAYDVLKWYYDHRL